MKQVRRTEEGTKVRRTSRKRAGTRAGDDNQRFKRDTIEHRDGDQDISL